MIRCGGERSDVELRLPVELLGEQYGLGSFYLEEEIGSGELFLDGEVITELVIDIDSSELLEDLDPETDKQVDDPDLVEELEEALFDVRVLDGLEGDAESVRLLVGATALDEVDTSLRAVRRALLVGVPILILVLGVLTWLLVGRALRPVQRISERVDEISSANLHERVPGSAAGDEISELATVMNRMLDRVEDGSERQRQFSADASHELRSPLSTIRAAAEMIGRSPGGPRISELVDDITAESDRVDVLIGGLLMLSRLDEQRLDIGSDSLDLAALVHAVVADVIADEIEIAINTGAVGHVDGVVVNGLPSLNDDHVGKLYELTGPQVISLEDSATILSDAIGRPVQYVSMSHAAYTAELTQAGIPDDSAAHITDVIIEALDGRNAWMTNDVELVLGRPARTINDYARNAAAAGAWALPA